MVDTVSSTVPPRNDDRPGSRGALGIVRVILAVITICLLVVPVVSYRQVRHSVQLGEQKSVEPPALDPDAVDRYQSLAATLPDSCGGSCLLVLGYADIGNPGSASGVSGGAGRTVTPERFAEHLGMLRTAGFRSVSAEQVAAAVRGESELPDRAVLITFDAPRRRLWTYADRILAAQEMSALVFVDPNDVRMGDRRYLSWRHLRELQETGRWSIGQAASDPSGAVRTSQSGDHGSLWVSQIWDDRGGRQESVEEFRERIGARIDKDQRLLIEQRLRQPVAFSFPFDGQYPLQRVRPGFRELSGVVGSRFVFGALSSHPAQVADQERRKQRVLPRIEVFRATTADMLFSRLRDAVLLGAGGERISLSEGNLSDDPGDLDGDPGDMDMVVS